MFETGIIRNLLNKFKEIQYLGFNLFVFFRFKKEFIFLFQLGVYENIFIKGIVYEERVAESGILENNLERREGVVREEELFVGIVVFLERGYVKNMVLKWKQFEIEYSKLVFFFLRYKEFISFREEFRIKSFFSFKFLVGINSSVYFRDLFGQY